MKLYGIPNCTTVKKARSWLDAHHIEYEFHDFKKAGVPRPVMESLLALYGWERMINRNGPTWRNLPEEVKAGVVDSASALSVMLEHSSAIRRPVLERDGQYLIGFSADDYAAHFES